MDQKQEFLGGLIGGILVKKGVEFAIDKAIDKVAKSPSLSLQKKDAPAVKEIVKVAVEQEVQAQVEHRTDTEPHVSSRNVWGVIFGLMGEGYILYTFWTDTIPQDFQADVVPHLLIIGGLLTPLYSRFIAKKPLGR
jgi:hypothetical protein